MPAGQGDISLYQCSRKVIEDQLCPYVNNAVVFLDDSSAEIIHWHGGASLLFDYGALDVREFSSFEVYLCLLTFITDVKHFYVVYEQLAYLYILRVI